MACRFLATAIITMVGVPGRSKGCITCRQRRKGCGLEKPTCLQCTKAGLKCGGYDAPRVFVVSTPDSRHPGYSLKATTTAPQPPSALWHRIQRNQVSGEIANLRLLARPEEQRRCIHLFWEAYFPSGQPIPLNLIRSYTCTWTETARKLYKEEESLRYALWANCLLVTGNQYGATWMVKEASILYGKALSGLRASLESSQGAKRSALIATVKLLGMFEAFSRQPDSGETANHPPSWQRHHAGELALFIARTPLAHISGDAHHVFADERVEMALSSILRRRRLVLSTPEWKAIPWQHIPKDMKDILVDVLIEMPGLVEDLDEMRSSSEDDLERREDLRLQLARKCWGYHRDLLSWLDLLNRIVQPPDGSPCPDAKPKSPGPKDVVTHIAQVHGMSLFWLTSLVLYSVLRMVCGSEEILPERADPIYHARRLVEAINALMRPEAGLYGRQSATLQIEVATEYIIEMDPSSEESEALLTTLKSLRSDRELRLQL
ncbi:hypothetical protein B0H63DRAFT_422358 [Podospora didyma]|uniref:Zn(2)-C6 fungal-type domain-containing protein n=1 Tax=Podospora didyma TaxID=330526 RepID=A0AAE0N4J7_9PEZI|nr:hypothetical protein B0H63DRAFT_422358 [Podospora didyma]